MTSAERAIRHFLGLRATRQEAERVESTSDITATLEEASRLRTELALATREIDLNVDERVVTELETWLADPQRTRTAIELLGVLQPSYSAHLIGNLVELILVDRYLSAVVTLLARIRPIERDGPVTTQAFLLYENYPGIDVFRRLQTLLDRTGLHRQARELAELALSSDDKELRDEATEHVGIPPA